MPHPTRTTLQLIEEISESLSTSCTSENCTYWATYIIENKIPVSEFSQLLFAPQPLATRFTWVLGTIVVMSPTHIAPAITYFFNQRHKTTIPGFNRSLAKMFAFAGIPEEIEGEAIDELFRWLADKNSNVSTKTYAITALHHAVRKYPDLKNEFRLAVFDQMGRTTIAFKKRAEKILKELG